MTSEVTQKMASLLGQEEKVWNHDSIPDLTGKTYLVTGGSAGIGYGVVSALLSHNPHKIVFLSNQEHKAEEKLEALRVPRADGKHGGATAGGPEEVAEKVAWVKCDLENLKETDRVSIELARRFREEWGGRLDGVVANAGIGIGKYRMSPDGIESHFQINHLSHMHMILTLLPLMRDTAKEHKTDVRLVLQTSENHRLNPSSVKFESLSEINTDVGAAELYNRTKLAQVLFMHALIRRLESGRLPSHNCPITCRSATIVNCTHPGIVWTEQQQQMEEAWGLAGKMVTSALKPFSKDPVTEGCLSALYALTDKNIPRGMPRGGAIYGQYITPPNKISEESTMAQDVGLQERLWELSEKLLNERLGKVGNV